MPSLAALIDYDNVRDVTRENTRADVQSNLERIADVLVRVATQCQLDEVQCRLYGGWTFRDGQYTERATWMLASLTIIRGLRSGVRLLPHLVEAPVVAPALSLRGTYRRGDSPETSQKMVDTLLTVDAVHLVRFGPVLIGSDDDDLVPAALHCAATEPQSTTILRRRTQGAGLNDHCLTAVGAAFFLLEERHGF